MCLFSKKEYKEVYFPFVLITNLQEYGESEESGIFDIEANGDNRFLNLECVGQGWDRVSLAES